MSADRRPSILFFDSARPGTLPPAFDLDPDDAGTIVGGVEFALALHISARAAELVEHYALQEFSDRNLGDHFGAARSRRLADEWLDCHEASATAASDIYQARLN